MDRYERNFRTRVLTFQNCKKKEMTLKAPSNTAAVWGCWSPPSGPEQRPGVGPGEKAPGSSFYIRIFTVPLIWSLPAGLIRLIL